MPATVPGEESQAFARAFRPFAYTDVVEVTEAQAVNRKAAPADFAGDFVEGVKRCLVPRRHAKNTHAIVRRGPQK